jgi:hypothetical protein
LGLASFGTWLETRGIFIDDLSNEEAELRD